jgi:hypothetical protein
MTTIATGGLTLQRGKIQRAQKAGIHGPESVGKSTLASQMPAPVFIDAENGTAHLDITRLAELTKWEDVTAAIQQLATTEHEFKTVVIDTIDWCERLLIECVCRKANKGSIEDFGYGKGYVLVAEEFGKFLLSLDALIKRGIHVVCLAHSTVRKFELPEQAGSYDRYELKLTKHSAPLLKEWCDHLFFCNFVTKVAESDSGRKRGVGGRERVIFTTHAAAFDAKNRAGLPDRLPFTFEAIASAFGVVPTPAEPTRHESTAERLGKLFAGREDAVKSFLIARGQIKAEGTWADISSDYATRVLEEPERFLQAVEAHQTEASK